MCRKLGLEANKVVKLESAPKMGYFFRVSRKVCLQPTTLGRTFSHSSVMQEEKAIRDAPGVVVLDTQKSGVRFTNVSLRALSENYSRLTDQYNTAQSVLAKEVISIAGTRGVSPLYFWLLILLSGIQRSYQHHE
jgi:hypothetical protein